MPNSYFSVTTHPKAPLDASSSKDGAPATVSNFLTVQSFTNFAAIAGAISAAWHAMRLLSPSLGAMWVPYALAFAWGAIAFVMSWESLRREKQAGSLLAAAFIAFVNSLVLAGAVVGTDIAFAGATPTAPMKTAMS